MIKNTWYKNGFGFSSKKLLLLKVEVEDNPQLCKLDPEFEQYIRDFRVCQKILMYVNELVELVTQIRTDIQGNQYHYVLNTFINNIEDVRVPEINIDQVRELNSLGRKNFIPIWGNRIQSYLDNPDSYDWKRISNSIAGVDLTLLYSNKSKNYLSVFHTETEKEGFMSYEYILSLNSMKTILYTLFYRGYEILSLQEDL